MADDAIRSDVTKLDNKEAARFLKLSPRTLEKMRVVGGGPRFRKHGRRVLYAASYEDMRRLLAFLTEDCCSGNPDICGPLDDLVTPCTAETVHELSSAV